MRGGAKGRALAVAAALALAAGARGAVAQEAPGEVSEPAMPEAPVQFRVAPSVSVLSWDGNAGAATALGDATLLGIDVESRLGRFVAFRFDVAYGKGDLTSSAGTVEANQFLLGLRAEGRLDVGPFRRFGVVPFATAGVGSLVHDPVPSEIDAGGAEPTPLITKSQSTLGWGAGVDLDLLPRFGARLEWRRYDVELVTVFDPQDRSGVDRRADRLMATVYWKL